MTTYCVPDRTGLLKYVTKDSYSKNEEWLYVEGVPCEIHAFDGETYTLQSFTSCRCFHMPLQDFEKYFSFVTPDESGYLHLSKYLQPIHVDEFKHREKVSRLKEILSKIQKDKNISEQTRKIFEDKVFQILQAQGNIHTINVDKYKKFKSGELTLSKHQRIGDPVFNRATRWSPPVDITNEEFEKSPSYPAPMGIRPKDHCFPSELIGAVQELILQIVNFANFPQGDFDKIKDYLPFIEKKECFCKYCGDCLDYTQYESDYKSAKNFMEICHRDPNKRFVETNMYWGHCDCNRKQGGYTEVDIMKDGLRLMYLNGIWTKEEYEQQLSRIN